MGKSGHTEHEKDWLGRERDVHYDEDGKQVGYSKTETDWLGRTVTEHFDNDDRKTGYSENETDWLGRTTTEHYDTDDHNVGHSKRETDWLNRTTTEHYDADDRHIGSSERETDWLGRKTIEHEGINPRYPKASQSSEGRSQEHDSSSSSSTYYSSSDSYASSSSDSSESGGGWGFLMAAGFAALVLFAVLGGSRSPQTAPQQQQPSAPEPPGISPDQLPTYFFQNTVAGTSNLGLAEAASDPAQLSAWIYKNRPSFYKGNHLPAEILSSRLFQAIQIDVECKRELSSTCGLDWYPWDGTQDPSIQSPVFRVVSMSATEAIVQMDFRSHWGPKVTRLLLTRNSGDQRWALDDIEAAGHSMRRALESSEQLLKEVKSQSALVARAEGVQEQQASRQEGLPQGADAEGTRVTLRVSNQNCVEADFYIDDRNAVTVGPNEVHDLFVSPGTYTVKACDRNSSNCTHSSPITLTGPWIQTINRNPACN